MKKSILIVGSMLIAMSVGSASADQWVNGYMKRDGTYVQGYMRSSPNSYKFDNYSSKGNTNPYTGKKGYGRSEYSSPSIYDYGYGSRKSKRGYNW